MVAINLNIETTLETTDSFVLTSTEIANRFVLLTHTPAAASVEVEVAGGVKQLEGSDYALTGNRVSWTGLGMQSFLAAGDTVLVHYEHTS